MLKALRCAAVPLSGQGKKDDNEIDTQPRRLSSPMTSRGAVSLKLELDPIEPGEQFLEDSPGSCPVQHDHNRREEVWDVAAQNAVQEGV
jgi:hypothetical protein